MTGIGYVKIEEVPGIPRQSHPPGVVIHAPLGDTPVEPDVVLFVGRPGRMMLLQEASVRAEVGAQLPLLGRPTCMALPAALAHGVVASMGCIGNRAYTTSERMSCTSRFLGKTCPELLKRPRPSPRPTPGCPNTIASGDKC